MMINKLKRTWSKRKSDKHAQVQFSFNWIFVLIAGAVILIFFASIALKQKASSEEYLATDVVRVMDTIFTGAGVSEKTKNFIDTSGLKGSTIYFDCTDGVGEYGLEGRSAKVQNTIDPLFAPLQIKSTQLIAWSLPYLLPYKAADFLFITSPNIKYYFWGVDEFADELEKQSKDFGNFLRITQVEDYDIISSENYFHLRMVDLDGSLVLNRGVPEKIRKLEDEKVSAVVLQGDLLDYYQKQGSQWKKLNTEPLSIISLGGERDAARYAAIFAGSPGSYQCNMQKAYQRLELVTSLYFARAEELEEYYRARSPTGECITLVSGADENIKLSLRAVASSLQACKLTGGCNFLDDIQTLQELNNKMSLNCIPLY